MRHAELQAHLRSSRGIRACGLAALVILEAITLSCDGGPTDRQLSRSTQVVFNVSGLPDGATAAVHIAGDASYTVSIAGSASGRTSITQQVVTGTYTITADQATSADDAFAPPPIGQVYVPPGTTTIPLAYSLATGRVNVSVTGLPLGAPAAVQLSAGTTARAVTGSGVVTKLAPGTYAVGVSPILADSMRYAGQAVPSTLTVLAVSTPGTVAVAYQLASGSVHLATTDLPAGGVAMATLVGADGVAHAILGDQTAHALVPGPYVLTADPVIAGDLAYTPVPRTQSIIVSPSLTPSTAAVRYELSHGDLVVTLNGLPNGAAGAVTVTGPRDFSKTLTASTTLTALPAGIYTVSAAPVTVAGESYEAVDARQTFVVQSNATTLATVTYAPPYRDLVIGVSGLPAGAGAAITVTGPNAYTKTLTRTDTLQLPLGAYTITAGSITVGGVTYAPSPATQTATLTTATSSAAVTVSYAVSQGGLAIALSGLPAGASGSVTVTGPGGARTVTGSTTLHDLAPGLYTIAPTATVMTSAGNFHGAPETQTVTVTATGTATATVAYAPSLNLVVARAYFTQSQQSADGTIPLVQNRAALLRVLVTANEANVVKPNVRARFYQHGALVSTATATASAAVPLTLSDVAYTSAWAFTLAGGLVQPGLAVVVDIDPTSAITETNRGDDAWPASGTLAPVVHDEPPFHVTLIPVLQSTTGSLGNVSTGNVGTYLDLTGRVYPMSVVDPAVHAVYTTSAPALQSGDENGAWSQILNEIQALRVAEGSARTYYGVVHLMYSSGIFGLGYIGYGAAIGADVDGAQTMAHELGHTFGRMHAPCGNPSDVDPNYPYAGAALGMPGIDVASATFYPATAHDLMSYCYSPWVSDYTYRGVMTYRESQASASRTPLFSVAAGASSGDQRLLVWGRIGRHGVVLEPAFSIDAPAALPAMTGPAQIVGLAADGHVLFTQAFAATPIADGADSSFAFAVPIASSDLANLSTIRLTTAGRKAERRMARDAAAALAPAVTVRREGGVVMLQWDAAAQPVLLVRDAATGQVLSFARGGRAAIRSGAATVTINGADRPMSRSLRVSMAP